MAGAKPFHSAVTPSCAMSLRVQSIKPEYVPCGADWRRDLIVYLGQSWTSRAHAATDIRRDGERPHGHSRAAAGEHDGRDA